MFGKTTTEKIQSKFEITASIISEPQLSLTIGVEQRFVREITVSRTHPVAIHGIARSEGGRHDNVVIWKINEN